MTPDSFIGSAGVVYHRWSVGDSVLLHPKLWSVGLDSLIGTPPPNLQSQNGCGHCHSWCHLGEAGTGC